MFIRVLRLILCALCILYTGYATAAPRVVTTIKPLAMLANGLLVNIGRAEPLLPDSVSPHHYAMRPSDLKRLKNADLIIWVGPNLETFLKDRLDNFGAQTLEVMSLPNLDRLEYDPHHASEHEFASDPHLWLDPKIAITIIEAMSERLIALDPKHKAEYLRNQENVISRLHALDNALSEQLVDAKKHPFFVAHDGLGYFNRAYGLQQHAVIIKHDDVPSSPRHLQTIHREIRSMAEPCVFFEPQTSLEPVLAVTEHTTAKRQKIDIVGIGLGAQFQDYELLLKNLARSMKRCLVD